MLVERADIAPYDWTGKGRTGIRRQGILDALTCQGTQSLYGTLLIGRCTLPEIGGRSQHGNGMVSGHDSGSMIERLPIRIDFDGGGQQIVRQPVTDCQGRGSPFDTDRDTPEAGGVLVTGERLKGVEGACVCSLGGQQGQHPVVMDSRRVQDDSAFRTSGSGHQVRYLGDGIVCDGNERDIGLRQGPGPDGTRRVRLDRDGKPGNF